MGTFTSNQSTSVENVNLNDLFGITGDVYSNSVDTNTKTNTVDNSETRENNFSIPEHSIANFSDFNDYNNITTEGHYIMYHLKSHTDEYGEKTEYPDGTTHVKMTSKEDGHQLTLREVQDDLGTTGKRVTSKFGDTLDVDSITVEEYIYDEESGFDALILKDASGNYKICYGSTDDEQTMDWITDAGIGFENSIYNNIASKITSAFGYEHKTTQERMAQSTAQYLYEKAESEGVKMSLSGYSLGGALCENGAAALMENSNYDSVVDGIILVNPFHADLSSDQIEKLKNTSNFNLYANEYDIVHTVNHYDDYKDVQKLFFLPENMEPDGDNKEPLFDAIFGNAHSIEYLENDADIKRTFNADGSLKTKTDSGYVATAGDMNTTYKKHYGHELSNFSDVFENAADSYVPEGFWQDALTLVGYNFAPELNTGINILTFNNPQDTASSAIAGTICKPAYMISGITELFGGEGFSDDIDNTYDNIKNGVNNFVDDSQEKARDHWDSFYEDPFGTIGNDAQSFVEDPLGTVGDAFETGFGTIANGASDAWNGFCDWIGW